MSCETGYGFPWSVPFRLLSPVLVPRVRPLSRRLGFLAGEITVPDDFDRMGQDEIARRFGMK